jgi:serine phosphatase RsbU (regulator of sigma subunit)
MKRFLLFAVLLLFIFPASQAQIFSTDLQKGFKAFDSNNYDKALGLFNDVLKKDSADAGAYYGIAEIYFSKNYSGYNVISSYNAIKKAQHYISGQSKKQSSSLAKAGIDEQKINSLRQKIDDEIFSITVSKNSQQAYDEFIRTYPDNANIAEAKELREQLSLYNASSGNSEQAMNDFIRENPKGKDLQKAVKIRNLVAFQNAKAANTARALEDFIAKYPDATEIPDAKAALATLRFSEAKKINTVESFDKFLAAFPEAEEFTEATTLRNQLAYIQLLEAQKNKDSLEIKKKDEDIEKKGAWLNFFLVGASVLLLVVGLLYYSYNQKKKSNAEITQQKEIIEQKNKEIVDSINYAKRIQDSMLPVMQELKKSFPESFVFFRPRNIVSGDFYWFTRLENKLYIAAADCTGHGVPGALVSMMGFNFLNQLVNEMNITGPGEILNQLHSKISHTLNKEQEGSGMELRDGMDIALLCIDHASHTISYAGAVRPLYYIDEEGLKTIKGGFYSIGGIKSLTEDLFTTHTVEPKGKATFYLFSDGFADQFGGPNGKKFKMKKFQELLLSMHKEDLQQQHKKIESVFVEWMGMNEQVDDVCVIGVRV